VAELEGECDMRADQVIERLCKLQAEVQAVLGYSRSADCFCGKSGFGPEHVHSDHYRNEGHCLEFIEKATRAALALRRDEKAGELA
jgi:hypothetical protein